MDSPTQILSDEHKNILKLIEALENECNRLESEKQINKEFFKKVLDFIRNYADKFHHAKEEEILFKELTKKGVLTHCNPVEQMLYEHDLGRDFVKAMEESLNKNNKEKIIENARGYSQLLKEHIFKEDNILYPMADEALNQKIQKSIIEKFNKIAKDKTKLIKGYISFINNLK